MVSFLHFSDIHIPDKRGDLWYKIDPFQKLDNLIEYTRTLQLTPDFTIITGDLSHTGTTQSYNHVKKFISKLETLGGPVFPTMGNHDKQSNFSKILLGKPSHQRDSPCYYSKTIEGLHVIAMDSHTSESQIGSLTEKQLDWLESELREHTNKRTIIAFHNPIYFFGELGLFKKEDALRFLDIVSAGNVLAVLNGHMHCPWYTIHDGVYYVQAGSPLWTNYYTETGKETTYDSSSFNFLDYHKDYPNRLMVRPVYFSKGQRLVDKTNGNL